MENTTGEAQLLWNLKRSFTYGSCIPVLICCDVTKRTKVKLLTWMKRQSECEYWQNELTTINIIISAVYKVDSVSAVHVHLQVTHQCWRYSQLCLSSRKNIGTTAVTKFRKINFHTRLNDDHTIHLHYFQTIRWRSRAFNSMLSLLRSSRAPILQLHQQCWIM